MEKTSGTALGKYCRLAIGAIVLAALAAAVWYGLVWLLVNRAD